MVAMATPVIMDDANSRARTVVWVKSCSFLQRGAAAIGAVRAG
jgi:hypothetical protein